MESLAQSLGGCVVRTALVDCNKTVKFLLGNARTNLTVGANLDKIEVADLILRLTQLHDAMSGVENE